MLFVACTTVFRVFGTAPLGIFGIAGFRPACLVTMVFVCLVPPVFRVFGIAGFCVFGTTDFVVCLVLLICASLVSLLFTCELLVSRFCFRVSGTAV